MSTYCIDRHDQRTAMTTRTPRTANTAATACARGVRMRGHRFERQDLCVAEMISRAIAEYPPQLYRGGA